MSERSLTVDPHTTTSRPASLNQRGAVVLDPDSMLVCKQFGSADAGELARREFDYLQRFSAVLAGQPFLRCAEPVRVEPEQGKLWMTQCPGSQLHHLLEASGCVDGHLDHLARQIAIALERYVTEFDEPYYDLAAWNMLYDESTRILSLTDFSGAGSARLGYLAPWNAPVDVSLGCLIGTAVYHTVRYRRSSWRKKVYWQRKKRLMSSVLDEMNARHDLHLTLIQEVSHSLYDALSKEHARPLRRLWFGTAGQALFNRRRNAIIARLAQRSS